MEGPRQSCVVRREPAAARDAHPYEMVDRFMDSQLFTSRPRGGAGPPEALRDQALASALRRLYSRLEVSTCTAYLLTADAGALMAAMTVDTPLSFSIPSGMPTDDPGLSTARAHRTGKLVVYEDTDRLQMTRHVPDLFLHGPYPMRVASMPLRTPRRRFGALSVRWVPPRAVTEDALEFLETVADELAGDLERLAEQGASMEAAFLPLFIPPDPRTAPRPSDGTPAGPAMDSPERPAAPLTTGSTFLYQLQRLSAELTATVRARDILAVARAHMAPFGARAVMLCLAEGERLHVMGAAGISREEVHRAEGTPLSQHTPETDVLNSVKVRFFASARELRDAYPDLAHDPESRARAYLPLVANGRASGCCMLEFAEHSGPLTSAEIAVLAIMLEQVGQSLERARAYEIDHALTRSLQRSLLPRSLPHLAEAVTTARYLPAIEGAEVGGDWYDVVPLPAGGIGLVIGDVEGHSLKAAGVMGQLRSAVRAYATEGHDPASVLERSNQLLAGLDTDLYATCCCIWLDLSTGNLSGATAGHPGPLISDARGRITQQSLPIGPPLGVDAHTLYQQSDIVLPPGSVAALVTDGLLDFRRLGADAALGQLSGLLADNCGEDVEVLADRLVEVRRTHLANSDDATLLLVRYEGAQPGERRRVARTAVQRRDLQRVAHMRHFLRDLLHQWDLAPLMDDLLLMASEVVTNALIHAQSEVDMRIREYPDRLRVEVRDSDPRPPVPTAILTDEVNNQDAESGRGLLIVDGLASAWGSSPAGRGKTTWFEIGIPPASD
jgi:serine phosphatase RsbU (regulator of sigma subunit)/anti-sigma regulatory factor (Ser/Thr protein kinase)